MRLRRQTEHLDDRISDLMALRRPVRLVRHISAGAAAALVATTLLGPPTSTFAAPPSSGLCVAAMSRLTEMEALTRVVADRSMRSLASLQAGGTIEDITVARQNLFDWEWVVAEGRSAADAISTPSSTRIRCAVVGARLTVRSDQEVVRNIRQTKSDQQGLVEWMKPRIAELRGHLDDAALVDRVATHLPRDIVDRVLSIGVRYRYSPIKPAGMYDYENLVVLLRPGVLDIARATHVIRHETAHALDLYHTPSELTSATAERLGVPWWTAVECVADAVSLELGTDRDDVYFGRLHPGKSWACIDDPAVRLRARALIAGPGSPVPGVRWEWVGPLDRWMITEVAP